VAKSKQSKSKSKHSSDDDAIALVASGDVPDPFVGSLPVDDVFEDAVAEPTADDLAEAGLIADPEPPQDEMPTQSPPPILPPIPSREMLIDDGFSNAATDIIIDHMTKMHAEVAALNAKPRIVVSKPALRLMAMRERGFWCCGRHLSISEPWEPLIEQLTEAQKHEIDDVRGKFISVEEIEVEIEIEKPDSDA
jgi:hypothetical protein